MRAGKDIDGGWAYLVLFACYVGFFVVCMCSYAGGIVYVALLEKFREDEARTAMVGALNTGIFCLLGPVTSMLSNRFTCRVCLFLGGILCTAAYLISAFSTSLDMVIFSYGALGGIGGALVATTLFIVLGYYFEAKRKFICSGLIVMCGIGMIVSTPLSLHVLEEYGMTGMFIIFSGMSAHLCVCAVICKPSSLEKAFKKERQRQGTLSDKSRNFNIHQYIQVDVFKNYSFILYLASNVTWNFTLSVCLTHLPNYIMTRGASDSQVGFMMTVFTVSHLIGRILAAMTVGKGGIDGMLLHTGSLGISGIVAITFPLYAEFQTGEYMFCILIGLYTGVVTTITTAITLTIVGVNNLSMGQGLIGFSSGIGYLAGPPISGMMLAQSGSYSSSFILSGLVILCGSFLAMMSAIQQRVQPEDVEVKSSISQHSIANNIAHFDTGSMEDELESQPLRVLHDDILNADKHSTGVV
ncbi:hypothetical protein CHS0354_033982 [Potamilus streckersoni]|uniref:Major facilitator superfamily (MFS) profile domain-containing protein n=1 Tax=Potamilus streckersoni TaxID=2493646 RepID=A0AAE0W9V0_9BIVA|nr:hypothetical protein CHS0354_033982 [Potamilus streckersoni]